MSAILILFLLGSVSAFAATPPPTATSVASPSAIGSFKTHVTPAAAPSPPPSAPVPGKAAQPDPKPTSPPDKKPASSGSTVPEAAKSTTNGKENEKKKEEDETEEPMKPIPVFRPIRSPGSPIVS